MRVMILALAFAAAGCAALPQEVRIRVPDWMRGQGESRPADASGSASAGPVQANPQTSAAPPPASAAPSSAAPSSATPPSTTSPSTTSPSTTSSSAAAGAQGFSYPTGAFASVHQAFTAQVPQRFGAGQSQASIIAALRNEGYACAPAAGGAQVCERLRPIGQGCEDVFVVTAPAGGGGIGDVRRRCPVGVTAPQGAPLG